ncbi:hypothetical protein V7S43_009942 [Phytophthora oleae]|uniref:Uncharacterized protein n=1 Tax=Phytophthora oleae TaxID=2107226 RepID=A0ABD3FK02_9STRA
MRDNQTETQENLVKWRSQVMVNCEDRIRSERVNQELKDVLAQQLKLFGSLRKVLRRTGVAQEMEFVSQAQPTVDRPLFQIDYSEQILAELAHNVAQMYTKVEVSAASCFDEECSVTLSCQSNRAESDGKRCFNIMSRTPLVCTVTEARDILWDYVTDKENPGTRKAFNFTRARSSAGGETQSGHQNCITALFIQAGSKASPSFVNALGTYRKYERADRVVLVGGSYQLKDSSLKTATAHPLNHYRQA